MNKIIYQGSITILVFFLTWFGLSEIDWRGMLEIEERNKSTEEKLGDMFWDLFKDSEDVIYDEKIVQPIDSILTKICEANDIDRSKIKLHLINNEQINAFALPNNHLVVFSGLIKAAENEGEVSGVMGHEVAHIELNHVMKKLVKELGLSVLISMTGGGGGSEIIKEAAKVLSSSAYDRTLEKEADMKAVDYMLKANLNPEDFANFMFKLAEDRSEMEETLAWISTHPESKERAEYIIGYSKGRFAKKKPILSDSTWTKLKAAVE